MLYRLEGREHCPQTIVRAAALDDCLVSMFDDGLVLVEKGSASIVAQDADGYERLFEGWDDVGSGGSWRQGLQGGDR